MVGLGFRDRSSRFDAFSMYREGGPSHRRATSGRRAECLAVPRGFPGADDAGDKICRI